MSTLKPYTSLHGKAYTISKILGQGGFGITYLASDNANGRYVAIKEFFMKDLCNRASDDSTVSVPSTGSKEAVHRFKQKFLKEARTISSLSHPNIIRIYDVFEENATAYYVMEYISGGSLNDYIKKNGNMSESVALRYVLQVGDALHYLHGMSINHLDIKPDNILNDNGRAVLIDFGLAKRYDNDGQQTSTTPVGLSHGYAPLEQYKKGGVAEFSPTTDIYSLGATLYKLLTGQTPPDANYVLENGINTKEINASAATRKAIAAAMRPVRKNRPQSAAAFIKMLYPNWKPAVSDDDVEVIDAETADGNDVYVSSADSNGDKPKNTDSEQKGNGGGSNPKPVSSDSIIIWWILLLAGIGTGIYLACNGGGVPHWYKGVMIAIAASYKAFK